ncbi:MAG: cytochrome c [Pyrinomonadaceae bacterium]
MNMKILVFLVFAISAAACAENKSLNTAANTTVPANTATTPVPAATIDELASGKKAYEQNCANCHKQDGTGGIVEIEGKKLDPDDLTSEKISKFSDEKIIGYILKGVPDEGMPAFKGKLSEGEIRDVVKYIRTEFHKR